MRAQKDEKSDLLTIGFGTSDSKRHTVARAHRRRATVRPAGNTEGGEYEYVTRDDMRPAIGDILRLIGPVEAWNADGTADAVPVLTGSWIAEAEAVTGRRRGRCSFEGCPNMAQVGGHVWLARIGCVIAPICRPCNNPRNMARRQGGGSYLRANIEVFQTHMTEGMRNTERRYAEEPRRRCERCGTDISDRPPDHRVCYPCYRQIS